MLQEVLIDPQNNLDLYPSIYGSHAQGGVVDRDKALSKAQKGQTAAGSELKGWSESGTS